jgi:hypothetical protein
MNNRLICLLLIAGIVACSAPQQKELVTEEKEPKLLTIDSTFRALDEAYYIYVLGDWGRRGQFHQKDLATTMGLAARIVEPEFIISTGDNFYPNGVSSVDDPAWDYSFEDVYSDHSLNCDWYVVLGNHDYRGSMEAQIDYTNVSRRWKMPSYYFHKDVITDENVTARILFIDTNPLNDEYHGEEKYRKNVSSQDTTAQLQWMDQMLSESEQFDYTIVIGHHPLYTGGKRVNDTSWVRPHIEGLMEEHGVDVYIAGHEHDLQHIKPPGKTVDHFVSGAGSEVRPTGEIEGTQFARSIQGFLVIEITQSQLGLSFMDRNGDIIYRTSRTN